jgi:hypothetical protein
MRRRELITLLSGTAVGWPLAARAQQPGKLPTVGFLGTTTASEWSPWTAAFLQRLRELGWIEGRTIAFEYRWDDLGRVPAKRRLNEPFAWNVFSTRVESSCSRRSTRACSCR